MTIRVWKSFSCNNSSSYRLVARFADPAVAQDVAVELALFFKEHAAQMDALAADGDFPEDNPEAAQAFAQRYGFRWSNVVSWGDEMLEGDEPSVAAEGGVLVAYHTYCGGFDDGFEAYLRARGATAIDNSDARAPEVTLLFHHTAGRDAELDAGLAMLFQQIDGPVEDRELKTPWTTRWREYTEPTGFSDGKTVGLHFGISPLDLAACKQWLADHGVAAPVIALCHEADRAKFAAIAQARCTACEARLEYLDPRLHDIETAQLVCRGCGGLYEVGPVVEAFAKQQADA